MTTATRNDEGYEHGFNNGDVGVLKFGRGRTRQTVEDCSCIKQEPRWTLDVFLRKPMSKWGRQS